MSTFSGLSAAVSGLMAHRRAMEVASQNIANANTEGYSRQRADLQAIGGPVIAGVYSQAPGVGYGVEVDDVKRIRNLFLENRGRLDHAQSEYLSAKDSLLDRIQEAFAEPSDTALQSQLGDLWSSFADLANRPDDPAARTAVLQRGALVADTVHASSETLGSLWENQRDAVSSTVDDINYMAGEVARLNEAIVAGTVGGQPVNELSDQRDLLVMKLAEVSGARAITRDDGSMDVTLSGSTLVYGSGFRTLVVSGANRLQDQVGTPANPPNPAVPPNPVQITWKDTGTVATAASGKLAAHMEAVTTLIPGYAAKLDSVANNLTTSINAVHTAGFDRAGNAGQPFFTGTTAGTFALALSNSDDVAAASTNGGAYDGANADKIADIARVTNGPDHEYRQLVVNLGVEAQSVNRRATVQAAVVSDTDAARNSESGVSLDEEMTTMVTSERAYQAAAKVISTIDEMLDTIINRMGV